jgi:hypothetical protein
LLRTLTALREHTKSRLMERPGCGPGWTLQPRSSTRSLPLQACTPPNLRKTVAAAV